MAANHESIPFTALMAAEMVGAAARYKGFAEACMAEYNLEGWTVPDLINATDVTVIMNSFLAAAIARRSTGASFANIRHGGPDAQLSSAREPLHPHGYGVKRGCLVSGSAAAAVALPRARRQSGRGARRPHVRCEGRHDAEQPDHPRQGRPYRRRRPVG